MFGQTSVEEIERSLGTYKEKLDEEFAKKEFIKINKKNKFKEKGKVKDYKKLNMSITRLRNKFKSLKSEWCKLDSRIKLGSGLA